MGEADRDAVIGALRLADALNLKGRSFQSLSGGEQARVHFARLLASPAAALLLDEPCGALDIAHQLALMATLQAQALAGRAVLIVLHDLHLAERFCSRLLVMNEGRVIADAPAVDALCPDRLREVFGVSRTAAGGFAVLPPPDGL
jgi:iron complex transport system ATP-binding protein